jgi:hypothetical protein
VRETQNIGREQIEYARAAAKQDKKQSKMQMNR